MTPTPFISQPLSPCLPVGIPHSGGSRARCRSASFLFTCVSFSKHDRGLAKGIRGFVRWLVEGASTTRSSIAEDVRDYLPCSCLMSLYAINFQVECAKHEKKG